MKPQAPRFQYWKHKKRNEYLKVFRKGSLRMSDMGVGIVCNFARYDEEEGTGAYHLEFYHIQKKYARIERYDIPLHIKQELDSVEPPRK